MNLLSIVFVSWMMHFQQIRFQQTHRLMSVYWFYNTYILHLQTHTNWKESLYNRSCEKTKLWAAWNLAWSPWITTISCVIAIHPSLTNTLTVKTKMDWAVDAAAGIKDAAKGCCIKIFTVKKHKIYRNVPLMWRGAFWECGVLDGGSKG